MPRMVSRNRTSAFPGSEMRPPVLAVTVAVTAFGLGHLWSRSPIAPIAYSLPPLPTLPRPGPKSRTHSLAKAERWFQGRVSGAEHIDFYCAPNAVRCAAYTGLSDGSIVRFDPEAGPDGPIEFLNRTSVLHHGEAPAFLADCGDPEFAHLCGRPLGLKVTHDGTTLVIADATYGVLALDLATNALTLLANEYVDSEGVARRINMANSIAVCRDGSVYFTQTSTTFSLKNLMLDFMQARHSPQRLRMCAHARASATSHDACNAGASERPGADVATLHPAISRVDCGARTRVSQRPGHAPL